MPFPDNLTQFIPQMHIFAFTSLTPSFWLVQKQFLFWILHSQHHIMSLQIWTILQLVTFPLAAHVTTYFCLPQSIHFHSISHVHHHLMCHPLSSVFHSSYIHSFASLFFPKIYLFLHSIHFIHTEWYYLKHILFHPWSISAIFKLNSSTLTRAGQQPPEHRHYATGPETQLYYPWLRHYALS